MRTRKRHAEGCLWWEMDSTSRSLAYEKDKVVVALLIGLDTRALRMRCSWSTTKIGCGDGGVINRHNT